MPWKGHVKISKNPKFERDQLIIEGISCHVVVFDLEDFLEGAINPHLLCLCKGKNKLDIGRSRLSK
jgi:dihydroorotase